MRTIFLVPLGALALGLYSSGRCDTHYVSLSGSNEAPYLTPETAASWIQSAVDVASPGDTVVVGEGDYREAVQMSSRLNLVGPGPDRARLWGSIRCAPDGEVRALSVAQDWPQGDPRYEPVAIIGPRDGAVMVAGCRISGTFEEGVQLRAEGGSAVVSGCEIRAEGAAHGMLGVSAMRSSTGGVCTVHGCVFRDASVVAVGAGNDLWVSRCTFVGPLACVNIQGGRGRILTSTFERCSTALAVEGFARVTVESAALTRNAEYGLRCGDDAQVELWNCTITANACGVIVGHSEVSAWSCIIWGNGQDVIEGPPWWLLDAEYCDIGARAGNGNIDADPLFMDPAAGNYRLKPDSPCIDAGPDGASDLYRSYDLDGMPRVAYGGNGDHHRVDMGAYEYYINRLSPGPAPGQVTLTWSSWELRTYSIFYSHDLLTWHLAEDALPAGPGLLVLTTSWIDDGSKTGVPPSLVPRRFYRILENP